MEMFCKTFNRNLNSLYYWISYILINPIVSERLQSEVLHRTADYPEKYYAPNVKLPT